MAPAVFQRWQFSPAEWPDLERHSPECNKPAARKRRACVDRCTPPQMAQMSTACRALCVWQNRLRLSCRVWEHFLFPAEEPERLRPCGLHWRHHCTSSELACSRSELACSRSEPACSRSEPACSRSELVRSIWEPACGIWEPACGTSWEPVCSSRCGCQTTSQPRPNSYSQARMRRRRAFQSDSASSLSSSGHD